MEIMKTVRGKSTCQKKLLETSLSKKFKGGIFLSCRLEQNILNVVSL